MALTNAWNEATPTDENYGFELDDYLRQLALNVRERIGVQHKTYSGETGHTDVGEHKPGECNVVFVGAKASFPVPATSNAGCFAVATNEGNQLYYWSGSAWTKVQEPVVITGDQTIAGAKTFSGAVTLSAISSIKDGSVMSTSGAPTEDAMIANKKYVDDEITAAIAAITGLFGIWASKSDDVVYEAATDGLVIAIVGIGQLGVGYTDSSNPPTTERCRVFGSSGYRDTLTMPVKKGDFWEVTGTFASVYWLPLGV